MSAQSFADRVRQYQQERGVAMAMAGGPPETPGRGGDVGDGGDGIGPHLHRAAWGFSWTFVSFSLAFSVEWLHAMGLGKTTLLAIAAGSTVSLAVWGFVLFVIACWFTRWPRYGAFGLGTVFGAMIPLVLSSYLLT